LRLVRARVRASGQLYDLAGDCASEVGIEACGILGELPVELWR
jgi:hypothetical protein